MCNISQPLACIGAECEEGEGLLGILLPSICAKHSACEKYGNE